MTEPKNIIDKINLLHERSLAVLKALFAIWKESKITDEQYEWAQECLGEVWQREVEGEIVDYMCSDSTADTHLDKSAYYAPGKMRVMKEKGKDEGWGFSDGKSK